MAISKEEVFKIAEKISSDGEIPSSIKIREVLKTGSLGTIQKYLQIWRHKEALSEVTSNPPPDQILQTTKTYLENIWVTALHFAQKEATIKIEEARKSKETAENDSETAWNAVSELESKYESLLKENELSIQNLKNLEIKLNEFKELNSSLSNENSTLKQNVSNLETELNLKLTRINEELEIKQSHLQKISTLEKNIRETFNDLNLIKQELSHKKEECLKLHAITVDLTEQNKLLKTKLDDSQIKEKTNDQLLKEYQLNLERFESKYESTLKENTELSLLLKQCKEREEKIIHQISLKNDKPDN